MDFFSRVFAGSEGLSARVAGQVAANSEFYGYITLFSRFALVILAVFIVTGCGISLLRGRTRDELWGYLALPNGIKFPIKSWENMIGRGGRSDIVLPYPSVSRTHAALIRDDDGHWTVTDLGSKTGTSVNGKKIAATTPIGEIGRANV